MAVGHTRNVVVVQVDLLVPGDHSHDRGRLGPRLVGEQRFGHVPDGVDSRNVGALTLVRVDEAGTSNVGRAGIRG